MSNNNRLCAYIYAADVYNNGEKLFDSFTPLIEGVLNISEPNISFLSLLEKINDTYKVKMPKATLQRLLQRMQDQGKLKFVNKNYIAVQGEHFDAGYWENKDKLECDISDLFVSFKQFLQDKGIGVNLNDAKKVICDYVFSNCYELWQLVGHNEKPPKNNTEVEQTEYIDELCEFIFQCKQKKNKNYNSLLRLYCGATQSTLLSFNVGQIEELENDNLNIKNVILDSNFLMRVLDIQTENECLLALDTLGLLKEFKINIYALSCSLNEVKNSINSYLRDTDAYSAHTGRYFRNKTIRMSGLVSAQQRGKTRVDLFEIAKYDVMKTKLEALGIAIIEVDDEKEFTQEEIQSLINYKRKDYYTIKQAHHDLFLIYFCRKKRKKRIDSFKEAEWWVLSNDIKLVSWNQKNPNDIQECLTEAQISNLFWLQRRKEENNGLISTIISLSSSSLVTAETLKRFIIAMQSFQEHNKNIPEKLDHISLVFSTDSISTKDIKLVEAGELEISKLIDEKAESIKELQKQQEKEYTETVAQSKSENDSLKEEMQKTRLQAKIIQMENEKLRIDSELEKTVNKIQETDKKISKLNKLNNQYLIEGKNLSRELAIKAIIIIVISILCSIIFSLMIKIPNISEGKISICLSLFTSFVIPPVIFLITAISTGEPKSLQGYWYSVREKRIERFKDEIDIKCIDKDHIKSEIEDCINQKKDLEETSEDLHNKLSDIKIKLEIKKSSCS